MRVLFYSTTNEITYPKGEVYQYQKILDQATASGQTHFFRVCVCVFFKYVSCSFPQLYDFLSLYRVYYACVAYFRKFMTKFEYKQKFDSPKENCQ